LYPFPSETIENKDCKVTKYRDKESIIIQKPCNLRAAHKELDTIFSKDGITIDEKTKMIQYHFSIGMWMRNNWGFLNDKSHLIPYFESKHISQPDDMSEYILDTCKVYALVCRNNPKSVDSLYSTWNDIECKRK
jgi:hypothetical protein